MSKIKEVIHYLDSIAPNAYQESYDNAGLLTGDPGQEVKGISVTLDVTEDVVQEAIEHGCNLIVSHHPIIFKGLKKLTGSNYVERTIIKAIQNNIAIYGMHTNLDNIHTGVNRKICEKLGLKNCHILSPKSGTLSKLTTFVPKDYTTNVLDGLFDAGAGNIGEYSHCSYVINGRGTFLPGENANPHIGKQNELEEVNEDRIEVVFPSYLKNKVTNALNEAHPYEEVAYYLHDLVNANPEVGAGMTGRLDKVMTAKRFIQHLRTAMNLKVIRHTALISDKIEKVAVCGGAGSFLLPAAINAGAQVFISSDFKYHEFFDADGKITIMDIGHYESEVFTKELLHELLYKKFPNIALQFSKVNSNPIDYAV